MCNLYSITREGMDTGTCFDAVGHAESRKKAYELKFAEPRLYADPDAATRKLVEIASTIEPVQNGGALINALRLL